MTDGVTRAWQGSAPAMPEELRRTRAMDSEQAPERAEAWYELGLAAMMIGRPDLADDAWRKARGDS